MEHLFKKLEDYGTGEIYPYHMPGHKRRSFGELPQEMCRLDITEIDGFDNLHQPEEILKELQEHAARLYGAEESFYLVNGSTAGILAAVSAALPAGGHILMARNCHKSAYHVAYLRNLTVSYLYPELMKEYDIFDGITPTQVRKALEREPDIAAVLVVSPTYEGRLSDIREIAEIVHERGIPLIVDEAHGAHLGFTGNLAPNSCKAGADLVIHSVHKTLPALTQTALLHVNGQRIDRKLLQRFLHIYQTSSPSYLLMASIDNALQYVGEQSESLFSGFVESYDRMLEKLGQCRCLQFLPRDRAKQDVGKLVISTKMTDVSGKELYDILLKRYGLQLEMAAETYALAMFTVNDSEEGYRRMTEALLEIDGELQEKKRSGSFDSVRLENLRCGAKTAGDAIPLADAWDMASRQVPLQESIGRYAGEFVNLYPPGIPLLVPGERITEALCEDIQRYIRRGLTVQGIETKENIEVISVLDTEEGTFLGEKASEWR